MQILKDWPKLVLEDAIPLLSNQFSANHIYNTLIRKDKAYIKVYTEIRKKAIECLDEQEPEVLKLIMVQLVQAYRYENLDDPEMKDFFFKHVFKNLDITNNFHWLVHLDKEYKDNESEVKEAYEQLYKEFMEELESEY